ncbi:MAG: hypothetical protein QNJ20_19010 [Paracoccaceae bacterium]|nr:hypothetical protein [Paracoccaceae bacterium]
MAEKGNQVVIRDPKGTRKEGGTSDFVLNGKNADLVQPVSRNVNATLRAMEKKRKQAGTVVVDLSKSPLTKGQRLELEARAPGKMRGADVIFMDLAR